MYKHDKNIKSAVRVLKKGGVIVYPTDTVYGLGADATNIEGILRLCQIKERFNRPISIAVSDLEMAERYVKFSKLAEKIFQKFMPGAVTMILPMKKFVPQTISMLSANTGMLGIRIPNNKISTEIIERLGNPITTSSANPRGGLSSVSVEQAREQFACKDPEFQPDFYLCGGTMQSGKPSTLVTVVKDKIEIIRQGAIAQEEILSLST
ncbi:MAG: L-threonylcarbamoyladenylate synthase [Candidatus Pacebacteria bacterium]|nr:L-threonylcarbamoyladenylate synthase [Candidatus Paceibacterota bacterium]